MYIYNVIQSAMQNDTPRFTAAYALQRLSSDTHRDLTRFADDRQATLVRMTTGRDQRA